MAYSKQTWANGDVITEEKLNHIEDGIDSIVEMEIDDTLLIAGKAADAKAAGDEIAELKNAINAKTGLSEEAKQALLDCFENVAWINGDGRNYYDALYAALYSSANLVSISAVFTQSDNVIYDTDSLDTLKHYLVVTATYSDSSTDTVTNYTLSGTLTAGTSTITVTYVGKTTTFNVTVTHRAATLTGIDAVFTPGSHTVYDTDSLDSLKDYLVVTAHYDDSSTATVASTDYTLSGTLAEGTSTITVSYSGKTDTFTVTVTALVPSEYQRVEYLQSTGDEYIDTGIYGNLETSVEVDMQRLSPVSDMKRFFGSRVNTYNSGVFIGSTGQSESVRGVYCQMSNGEIRLPKWTTDRVFIKLDKTGSYVDGTRYNTWWVSSSSSTTEDRTTTFTTPNTLIIFNAKQNGSLGSGMQARLFGIIIKDGTEIVFNGQPCYRKSDSIPGLFDVVSQTFFTNESGSGAFTVGGNV